MCGCNQEVKSVYCGEGDCIPLHVKLKETQYYVDIKCVNCDGRDRIWIEKGIISFQTINNHICRECKCQSMIKDF